MSKNDPKVLHKTEVPGFYKSHDGVLINKDNEALAAYKKKKIRDQQIEGVIQEMHTLKNDISEIKELLKGLIK